MCEFSHYRSSSIDILGHKCRMGTSRGNQAKDYNQGIITMATTIKAVADQALACADAGIKMTEVVRDCMAGIPPAKRDERIKAVYKQLRTVDGKVIATLGLPERNKKAYDACRTAYSALYGKKKKGASKRKAGKATVTKVTGVAKAQVKVIATKPKKLSDTLRVILATIQATEKPEFKDAPKLCAAIQVAIDLAV